MKVEREEEIRKLVLDNAKKGKISCKRAFEIAELLGVPVRDVGRVIDELGIKIVICQLGCF